MAVLVFLIHDNIYSYQVVLNVDVINNYQIFLHNVLNNYDTINLFSKLPSSYVTTKKNQKINQMSICLKNLFNKKKKTISQSISSDTKLSVIFKKPKNQSNFLNHFSKIKKGMLTIPKNQDSHTKTLTKKKQTKNNIFKSIVHLPSMH